MSSTPSFAASSLLVALGGGFGAWARYATGRVWLAAIGPVAASAFPWATLTANVLAHQRRAYLDAGMDGVVGKPISPGVLLREIARLSAPAPEADEIAAA